MVARPGAFSIARTAPAAGCGDLTLGTYPTWDRRLTQILEPSSVRVLAFARE